MPLTDEEFAMRAAGITSTDAVVLSGESPYGMTEHDIFIQKTTAVARGPSTLPQRIGEYLEPLVCDLTAEQFKLSLAPREARMTRRHPTMPWAMTTPDRMTTGADVVEAKVKSVIYQGKHLWDDPDAPPSFVQVQCQWHMIVTGARVVYVGALLGASPRFWVVEHDDGLASALVEMGEAFLRNHVLPRIPPTVDGSDGAARMLKTMFPRPTSGMIKASPEVEELAMEYFALKKEADALDYRRSQNMNLIALACGEAEGIKGDGWRLFYKERKAVEVRYTKEAYRHPDIREVKR